MCAFGASLGPAGCFGKQYVIAPEDEGSDVVRESKQERVASDFPLFVVQRTSACTTPYTSCDPLLHVCGQRSARRPQAAMGRALPCCPFSDVYEDLVYLPKSCGGLSARAGNISIKRPFETLCSKKRYSSLLLVFGHRAD